MQRPAHSPPERAEGYNPGCPLSRQTSAAAYWSVAAPTAFIGIRKLAWTLNSGVPMALAWLNVLEKGGHAPKELFSQLLSINGIILTKASI